jgi:hypothetical protein
VEIRGRNLVRALQELIAALDRRVPRVDQPGESSIARESAALRAEATARLAAEIANPDTPPDRSSRSVESHE